MPDLLALGAPDLAPARNAIPAPAGSGRWMRDYELCYRIPSGAGDECYVARSMRETAVFIRRFVGDRTDGPVIAEIKRRAALRSEGVEWIRTLMIDRDGGWTFTVTDMHYGASLRDLYVALHERGERLPWSVATALAHDVLVRLEALRAEGFVHPGITAPRIRMSLLGHLVVCQGDPMPRPEPPWLDVVWAALRPIFALAADDHERIVLADLLAEPAPDALAVACDAIAERHPEVDPLLPLALVHRAEQAQLAPLVDRAAVRRLWDLVSELALR